MISNRRYWLGLTALIVLIGTVALLTVIESNKSKPMLSNVPATTWDTELKSYMTMRPTFSSVPELIPTPSDASGSEFHTSGIPYTNVPSDNVFRSVEAPYTMELEAGWEYDSEPADFFLPPADGFRKGTAKMELGQVGMQCATIDQVFDQVPVSDSGSTADRQNISGQTAFRFSHQDGEYEAIWREGYGDVDLMEVRIFFIYDCHLWRVTFRVEIVDMEEMLPEFDRMINSIDFSGM
jgi:hypothetical protein